MEVEIIAIGDELLAGQTVDTNSVWLAQQLATIGIDIARKQCIRDTEKAIQSTFESLLPIRDIIFFIGGLGPTRDDITKKTIARCVGVPLVRHQPTYDFLIDLFLAKKLVMNPLNEQQADIPEGCIVLPNPVGTAPGLLLKYHGKLIFLLPGVPFELQAIVEKSVISLLSERFVSESLLHRHFRIVGIPESKLAQMLASVEDILPPQITLAYLPHLSLVRLRLTLRCQSNERSLFLAKIETAISQIIQITGKNFAGEGAETLEEYVLKCLARRKWTLATAESCTGGGIAARLTQVAGASHSFMGGIVAYSNQIKENLLHVPAETLSLYGAVSEEVVYAMASGACQQLSTDCAIAVSGIAGPAGGRPDKPVGTIWIAFKTPEKTVAKKFTFGQNRATNIELTILTALDMIRRYVE